MGVRIATAQFSAKLADVPGNLKRAAAFVAAAKAMDAQIVLLPETFTSGFSFSLKPADVAEVIPGPATDFLGRVAADNAVYLYGSMIERDGGTFYNTGVFISPSKGLVERYRKLHLFSIEKELFGPSDGPKWVDTEFGTFGLTICYDLCFPEYIRGLVLQGADIILNSTNWLTVGPSQDWDEWQWSALQPTALAQARALENTVGLAMCCQVGLTENVLSFGHSVIVSPSGRVLARLGEGEGVTCAEIAMERAPKFRELATYLPDRRTDIYKKLLDL